MQGHYLSDFNPTEPIEVAKPPRIVPAEWKVGLKQVDFVGYLPNPMLKRGLPRGEAAKAVAALRNLRMQPKAHSDDE